MKKQKRKQETKISGWRFDEFISSTKFFHRITELNGKLYLKTPIRNSTLLQIIKYDKYLFFDI